MQAIFSKILYEIEHKKDTVLVSIVADHGSAPRSAGARMLVGEKGRICGTIGGGAVEKNAEELARQVIREGKSRLHDYRLRKNEVEDLGMVCGGDVTVLFNYIAADDVQWARLAKALLEQLTRRRNCWLVCPLDGTAPSLYEQGALLAGRPLDAQEADALQGERPLLMGGRLFAERLTVGERVLIFGAGHIARALSPLLLTIGFRPVIYDSRPEYADPTYFPGAEDVICGDFASIQDRLLITGEDYVVVMTNGHSHDMEVQEQVMRGNYAYLGVIGSRAKIAALNKILCSRGITQEALDEVHTPIGVNIRAVTPEEIAVSIAGELICVRAERRERIAAVK